MLRSGSWMRSMSRCSNYCACPMWELQYSSRTQSSMACGSGRVKEFEEFLIFYLVHGDTLRVIRVLHGKRDLNRVLKKESAVDTLN